MTDHEARALTVQLKRIADALEDIRLHLQGPDAAEQVRVEAVEQGPGYPLARDRMVVPNSGVA